MIFRMYFVKIFSHCIQNNLKLQLSISSNCTYVNMKKILFIFLWIKLSIFLIIIFAYNLLPFASVYHYANFTYPSFEKVSLKTAFKTWDAQHYIYLSEKGYSRDLGSDRFFPLLPILIKLLTFITRN